MHQQLLDSSKCNGTNFPAVEFKLLLSVLMSFFLH